MNQIFDIYTILFLVVAVVIFLRLRNVLGRRTGHERPTGEQMAHQREQASSQDNVIPLPGQTDGAVKAEPDESLDDPKTPLEKTLAEIRASDPNFSTQSFLDGARQAYEMIVTAYATGDRHTLRPLLSKDVYEGFVTAIAEREGRGETVESSFVGIDRAEISDASLDAKTATVTVTFVSEIVSSTKDAEGRVIAGDPSEVSSVTDIWSFARKVNDRNPNWKLVSTETPDSEAG